MDGWVFTNLHILFLTRDMFGEREREVAFDSLFSSSHSVRRINCSKAWTYKSLLILLYDVLFISHNFKSTIQMSCRHMQSNISIPFESCLCPCDEYKCNILSHLALFLVTTTSCMFCRQAVMLTGYQELGGSWAGDWFVQATPALQNISHSKMLTNQKHNSVLSSVALTQPSVQKSIFYFFSI